MKKDEFLNKRQNKQFTMEEVKNILENDLHYTTKTVNIVWISENRRDNTQFIRNLEKANVPQYFAYIKFYTTSSDNNPPEDKIFALVAGKTNTINDIKFLSTDEIINADDVIHHRKDKAKKWLKAKGYTWYFNKVLIVYNETSRELTNDECENLAYSIEDDIGGLLGLFGS